MAQSLVLHGYRKTINTWNTNVVGTVNLLEALQSRHLHCGRDKLTKFIKITNVVVL